MPKTQTISVREFRQNLSLYLSAAKLKKIHFVVMNHSEPMAEIIPPKEKKKTQKQLREELLKDIQEAEAQLERGEWYTQEEMEELLRIRRGLPIPKGQKKISIVFPKPPRKGFRKK